MQGLIARKIGMTRIFDENTGVVIPVTILHTGANHILQVKTAENDGYSAVQLGFDVCPEKKVTKPKLGHFKKHKSEPMRIIKEFKLDSDDEKVACGQTISVDLFEKVDVVDVVGISKGRGFAGTVKRYGFHIGRQTHGNTNRRARGSLGAGTYPARVFPGLKMAGQYGNKQITLKGIKVVGLDLEKNYLYLKGGIPGHNKSIVYVKKNNSGN